MIPAMFRRYFPVLDEDSAPARPPPDDGEIGFPEEDDFPDEEGEDEYW